MPSPSRARGLLLESIAADSLALAVEVDADTRAAGAADTALVEQIDRTVTAANDDRITAVRDRAAERNAESGASGIHAVVGALQQAQVETLLLDARMLDSDATLLALPEAPWVANGAADTFDAGPGEAVSVVEALVRAALLTDAEVLFLEDDPAEGEARSDDAVEPPVAALRWPAASVTGGVPAAADEGHPSQAEGEDPDDPVVRPDPAADGHPSQAEG